MAVAVVIATPVFFFFQPVLQGLRGLVLVLLFLEAGVCVMLCVRITKEIRTRFHYAPIMVRRHPVVVFQSPIAMSHV